MSKLGPYELNTIVHGDCLEVMPQLPDGCFDAIICDLPYGKTELDWDSVIPLGELWQHYKRLLTKCGVAVFTSTQPFTSELVMSNKKWFRYEDIWHKSQATGHVNAYKLPMREHENILIFSPEGERTFNPQFYQKPIEYIRPLTTRTPSKLFTRVKLEQSRQTASNVSFPRSVVKINNVNGNERTGHPTQKPVALMSYLIRTYTNPGDSILDNCAGSGTTAIAAIETGRNWFCIEKDVSYFEIARRRIEERLQQPFLFEPVLPTLQPEQLLFEMTP